MASTSSTRLGKLSSHEDGRMQPQVPANHAPDSRSKQQGGSMEGSAATDDHATVNSERHISGGPMHLCLGLPRSARDDCGYTNCPPCPAVKSSCAASGSAASFRVLTDRRHALKKHSVDVQASQNTSTMGHGVTEPSVDDILHQPGTKCRYIMSKSHCI